MKQVAWAPKGQETLGAVMVPMGQQLNPTGYLELLRERLADLAEDVDQTELSQVSDLLMEAGLLYSPLDPAESLGRHILLDNEEMQLRLRSLGIPGLLPLKAVVSDKAALEALNQTNLLEWTMAVVSGLISRQ